MILKNTVDLSKESHHKTKKALLLEAVPFFTILIN
jgi:hypothetical protein